MAIEVSKISLTIPAGLTQKGEITVDQSAKTAKVVVTGATAGTHTVSVSYDGGAAQTCTVTVTPVPAFSGEPTAAPASIEVGADSTITQAFNVSGVNVADVTVTVPAGLTTKTAAAISGTTLTLVVTGASAGAHDVTLAYKGVTKTVTVTVAEPTTLKTVNASPTSVQVGSDSTVTMQF